MCIYKYIQIFLVRYDRRCVPVFIFLINVAFLLKGTSQLEFNHKSLGIYLEK